MMVVSVGAGAFTLMPRARDALYLFEGFVGDPFEVRKNLAQSVFWVASYFCPCRLLVKRTICLSP